jgi:hypothetical protein
MLIPDIEDVPKNMCILVSALSQLKTLQQVQQQCDQQLISLHGIHHSTRLCIARHSYAKYSSSHTIQVDSHHSQRSQHDLSTTAQDTTAGAAAV